MRTPHNAGSRQLALVIGTAILTLGACDRPQSLSPPPRSIHLSALVAPVNDEAMGPLTGVAQHISRALQDEVARNALATALKADSTARFGIDLQDCGKTSVARVLLAAGERRGGDAAANVCSSILRQRGLVLYMDPGRLSEWSGREVPIVTAIADPRLPLPRTFLGYRSPTRTIELPADGSLRGPILVIVPFRSASRADRDPGALPTARAIQVPDATQPHTPTAAARVP